MTDLISDTTIWWFGAVLLASLGYAGAVAVIAAVIAAATAVATYYLNRGGNLVRNLRGMHAWNQAGRPEWNNDGNCYVMKPTAPVKSREGH